MKSYLLVSGDFVRTGGMDIANLSLAKYLAEQKYEVHLVAHRVADELRAYENVYVHHVPKIAGSYLLSEPLLNSAGRKWAARLVLKGGRTIVNGGNCSWPDVNWTHYVHAAYRPQSDGNLLRRLKASGSHYKFLADEKRSLRRARLIIANSERTRRDIITLLDISPEKISTVYHGVDRDIFRPPTTTERNAVRNNLTDGAGNPLVVFVGALGDRRKGFDTLFSAWRELCADTNWDANLLVVGKGAELPVWIKRAEASKLSERIKFLGFRADVPDILKASDLMVAPTRYEAYGLGVQEALCCGLPAIVSRDAGIAERYPSHLKNLLLDDPNDVSELVLKLKGWRARANEYRDFAISLSEQLRAHTWSRMAAQIVELIEASSA